MGYLKILFNFIKALPLVLELIKKLGDYFASLKREKELKDLKKAESKFKDAKLKEKQDEAFDDFLDKSN